MNPQHNESLYEQIEVLDMLYRQELLGDCFVEPKVLSQQEVSAPQMAQRFPHASPSNTMPRYTHANTAHPNATPNFPHTMQSHYTPQNPTSTHTMPQSHSTNPNTQAPYTTLFNHVAQKVMACRLCSFAKMVQDNERFCGILPSPQNATNPNAAHNQSSESHQIQPLAFIVDTLRLKATPTPYNTHANLESNRANDMLSDIIQKVFLRQLEEVFILPLFKCAEVGNNQSISMQVRTQSLATQRRICGAYLQNQLEAIEYAVFFGAQMCLDFFEITLQEASGKILEYYTPSGKKISCVCVPDIMAMLMNTKLKKDAFINFVLLKNAISANSC